MTWTQNYDPFASALLSPLIAALPIVLLLGLLASSAIITLVNGVFYFAVHAHRLNLYQGGLTRWI